MDLKKDWPQIKEYFDAGKRSSLYLSMATVDEDGSPHITPIGSLFLRDDMTGFYFERFPKRMPKNLEKNNKICIMEVKSRFWPLLKSLYRGKAEDHPGIRLMGTVGEKRRATEEEKQRFYNRVKLFKGLKGYKLLWENMEYVRDIKFYRAEPVELGVMTRDL